MIEYRTGDATRPLGSGPRVIAHVCNDIGGWGRGFVVALSKRWSQPEAAYRKWHAEPTDPPFELGQAIFVEVEPELWVANMIGQHDVRTFDGIPPVRYEAIARAMSRVTAFAMQKHASVHMPRIGCGLPGGTWREVERVLYDVFDGTDLRAYVYDLPEAASGDVS